MAKHMGAETTFESHHVAISPDDAPCTLTTEAASPPVQKHRLRIIASSPLLGLKRAPTGFADPLGQRRSGPPPERNNPLLGTLSKESQPRSVEINVSHSQCTELRDSGSGSVENFKHGPIATRNRIVSHNSIEQLLDLTLGERLGETRWDPRSLDSYRWVDEAEALKGPEPEEGSNCHERSFDRGGSETTFTLETHIEIQIGTLDLVEILAQSPDPRAKTDEIAPIGRKRVSRSTTFGSEPDKKVFDVERKRCGRTVLRHRQHQVAR
jgi:hypothetical protein